MYSRLQYTHKLLYYKVLFILAGKVQSNALVVDIVSLVCCGNEFFVLHDSATSVSHVAVLSPPEAAQLLYRDGRHKECSQVNSLDYVFD